MTSTETLLVDVPASEAERLLNAHDALDVMEAAAEYRRQAHYAPEYIESEVEVTDADGDDPWYTSVLDADAATEGYLWSAHHFLGKARQQLMSGRYREGHCPDLDRLNGALGRLEEELRLMALAADPKTAAFAAQERARASGSGLGVQRA